MNEKTELHELTQLIAEQIQQATKTLKSLIAESVELNHKIERVGARIDAYEHVQDLISRMEAE